MIVAHITAITSGGLASVITNLMAGQGADGIKTALVYPSYAEDEASKMIAASGAEVIRLPIKRTETPGKNMIFGMYPKRALKELRRRFPGERIILHLHSTAAVGLFGRVKGLPCVCTIHGISSYQGRLSSRLMDAVFKKLRRAGTPTVFVSEFARDHYADRFDVSRTCVIYNAVRSDGSVKRSDGERFVIGSVGNLDRQKGWRYLVGAAEILNRKFPGRFRVLFAGVSEQAERDAFREAVENGGLSGSVEYVGPVDNACDNFIPKLDVLVLPSENEGLGLVVIEAFSHRVAALSTASGGVLEIIHDGENGLLCNRDAADIAEKLELLFLDDGLRSRLAEAGRRDYENLYTIPVFTKKYNAVYNEIQE